FLREVVVVLRSMSGTAKMTPPHLQLPRTMSRLRAITRRVDSRNCVVASNANLAWARRESRKSNPEQTLHRPMPQSTKCLHLGGHSSVGPSLLYFMGTRQHVKCHFA
ncbi:hypothetical protein LTR28_013463, partial [Elasticomyces elasticus]